jgi:Flp pilus assembly protein TadG
MLSRARLKIKIPIKAMLAGLLRSTDAAELIELAASLPLLVVFMVGIFDFSSAFILKQKIAHVAAEAARVAANQPMSDLLTGAGCGAPGSICAIRNVVDAALTNNGVNDCGLGGASATNLLPLLTWTFTASNGACSGLILTIERGYTYTAALPEPPFQANYTIEASRVTLSYPYQWQFGRVIGLIAPGANYTNSPIQSIAVMQNLN